MSDNDDDFKALMPGVKPIKPAGKVQRRHNREPISPGVQHRRQAATQEKVLDDNHLSAEHVELLGPHDVLSFVRDGVQHGVFRKLKRGDYQIEARLDLHRMTVEESRLAVFGFIKECCQYDLRTVTILHGKGERSQPQQALLKSYCAKWLKELPVVLAYHSASKPFGGVGAVVVLLKKSERLKQLNREKHGG